MDEVYEVKCIFPRRCKWCGKKGKNMFKVVHLVSWVEQIDCDLAHNHTLGVFCCDECYKAWEKNRKFKDNRKWLHQCSLNDKFMKSDKRNDKYWLYNTCSNEVINLDVSFKTEEEIGNCFRTKEEAERAVEKLKAWKRLKDAGFKFIELKPPKYNAKEDIVIIKAKCNWNAANIEDLKKILENENTN